jgi:orotidine-5'-phosphate decarboxylase
MMEDAKAAAGEHTKVVAVTVLTSLDDGDLKNIGVHSNAHDQALRLAELAHRAGIDGIVCSGHEVGAVRSSGRMAFRRPRPAPCRWRSGRSEARRHAARRA